MGKTRNGTHVFLKKYPKGRMITTAPGSGDIPLEKLIAMSVEEILSEQMPIS